MEAFLTGLGLAAPAGLNAYIPLLTLGLADRYTGLVELSGGYDALASDAGLITLGVLLAVEVVVDKIAGADHVNDAIQTVVRPAAGAYVMLASSGDDLAPVLDVLFGGGVAGSVHTAKAATRGVVTVSTLGLGNPVVSAIEDGIAFVSSVVAVALPLLVILVLPGLVALAVWALRNVPSRNGPQGRGPDPHRPDP